LAFFLGFLDLKKSGLKISSSAEEQKLKKEKDIFSLKKIT